MTMLGGFLSTLFPLTGPAVTQLFTASQMLRLLVEALLLSTPEATFVESVKLVSAGFARPDPPSLAVAAITTSTACHCPSAEPRLPTTSQTVRMPVEAFAVSVSPATLVDKTNFASA